MQKILKDFKEGNATLTDTRNELEKYFYSKKYIVEKSIAFDTHRQKTTGIAEAIYARGKTPPQLATLLTSIANKTTKKNIAKIKNKSSVQLPSGLLLTQLCSEKFTATKRILLKSKQKAILNQLQYSEDGQIAFSKYPPISVKSSVAIISAGTSDFKISKEVEVSLASMGIGHETFADIGIAGLGRLLGKLNLIEQHQIIIAIAGMEAALASVLASVTEKPIIAVPSPIGYGASFQGVAALLGLLNSCSPGIMVVNIGGGFQAAAAAAKLIKSFETSTF